MPGTADEVTIEFTPQEWRYYYDAIRINCESENILVPVHAYPAMGEVSIPSFIDMGMCPLSDTRVKKINITCSVPIDFDFVIDMVSPHPFFTVTPPRGTIPAKGSVDLLISYTPQNYTTVTMAFDFILNQYNSKPIRCSVSGSSTPGLVTAKHVTELTATVETNVKPTQTIKKTALKQQTSKQARTQQSTIRDERPPQIVDGVIIPNSLTTVHHLTKVLNQPTLDGFNAIVLLNPPSTTDRTTREEAFMKHLRDLSVHVGKGDNELTHDQRKDILTRRRQAEEEYNALLGVGQTIEAIAFDRRIVDIDAMPSRTYRRLNQQVTTPVLTYAADPAAEWVRRSENISRFVLAARKVRWLCYLLLLQILL